MKKALLPLAVAACVPVSAYAVGPIDGEIYGKVFVTMDAVDFESDDVPDDDYDQWEMNSNASRIGLEGKTALTDSLYAIYKAEFEIYVDDGDNGDDEVFSQRNIYVGLMGNFGTAIAGRHDTPTKLVQNKIDLFNDLYGDLKNTFEGENRESNIVMYSTPEMSGFTATLAFVASEGDDVDVDGEEDDGFDGTSLSLTYTLDDLYLGFAMDQDIDNQELYRGVVQYTLGDLQLGGMYQMNESSTGDDVDEDGWLLSAQYKMGDISLKGQYGMLESDADDHEEETFSVGADYKLAKNTKALVYYTMNTDEDGATSGEDAQNVFGFGMEHKF